MPVTVTVHTRGGLSVPFLRTTDEEGFKDGVWCPLQFIEAFRDVRLPLSVLKLKLKWIVRPDDDPYQRHCSYGHLKRRIAALMGYSEEDIAAIEAQQEVVLLSPFALSALLSVCRGTKPAWSTSSRQFDSEAAFVALETAATDNLDVLVCFTCISNQVPGGRRIDESLLARPAARTHGPPLRPVLNL